MIDLSRPYLPYAYLVAAIDSPPSLFPFFPSLCACAPCPQIFPSYLNLFLSTIEGSRCISNIQLNELNFEFIHRIIFLLTILNKYLEGGEMSIFVKRCCANGHEFLDHRIFDIGERSDRRSRGKNLGRVQGPLVNPRRPIVRRGRRGRDSETVTCRLNVTQDSRLFHSLPEERSSSLDCSFPRNNSREEMARWVSRVFVSFLFQRKRERGGERKREGEMRKEFEEREREESVRIYSLCWWSVHGVPCR